MPPDRLVPSPTRQQHPAAAAAAPGPDRRPRAHATSGPPPRRRMMWVSLTLLIILASVEAALALMRDMLIADKQALVQSLATVQQVAANDGWVGKIPTAGQMLLGFILPFALTFVAVPLESLIHSSRSVGGVVVTSLVRSLALLLRVLGNVIRQASRVLVHMYDVFIVVPLLIERLARGGRGRKGGRAGIGVHDDDEVVTSGRRS